MDMMLLLLLRLTMKVAEVTLVTCSIEELAITLTMHGLYYY